MQLCRDVGLGIQKLLQPGLFYLLYFEEFYLVAKVLPGFRHEVPADLVFA
jgi:hypothetical protein